MASTARSEEEKKEFFDSPEELERKVCQLADWVRESKHFIVFTGAGISTSAGIPDFRSGMNTKLETGPGAWELRANRQTRDTKKFRTTTTSKAIPTPTHMSYVKLVNEGLLKAVISQNCDGLHRRSGLPKNRLFELHGNSNVEKCLKCKREYLRDFRVRTAQGVHDHKTGNLCDDSACRGKLKDTIINFGENLPEDVLDESFDHSKRADLCIAMGSSLTVTPAADIPENVGIRHQRLVIINLQRTPHDSLAALRINGKCDDIMKLLMSKLGMDIPEFRLKRRVVVKASRLHHQYLVMVEGRDPEDYPFSFIKVVSLTPKSGSASLCRQEPFQFKIEKVGEMSIDVEFHAHYGEPTLTLPLKVTGNKEKTVIVDLQYNPFTGEWAVSRSDEPATVSAADTLATKLTAAQI